MVRTQPGLPDSHRHRGDSRRLEVLHIRRHPEDHTPLEVRRLVAFRPEVHSRLEVGHNPLLE